MCRINVLANVSDEDSVLDEDTVTDINNVSDSVFDLFIIQTERHTICTVTYPHASLEGTTHTHTHIGTLDGKNFKSV